MFLLTRLLLALALLVAAPANAADPDLVLTGSIDGTDHQTYRAVPFTVPDGVTGLRIMFRYTGREQKTTIDIGLADPVRMRGWSGGNKLEFFLAEAEATPSYLPGPIPPGPWRVILGVPNIRVQNKADYVIRIWFSRDGSSPAPQPVLAEGPGWYRGDLHLHSGHSDASCASQKGTPVPCPLFRTAEAAVAAGLDFMVLTDHNTLSGLSELRGLQPYYDRLLMIPGREITTFHGHANLIGPTAPLDFRLAGDQADLAELVRRTAPLGGILSINHPAAPSGEICMGCGWTLKGDDFADVQALEVMNGGILRAGAPAEGPGSGLAFWDGLLNRGLRVTGIAGSDSHRPDERDHLSAVGRPTTVVHAADLSQASILEGIRRGRVFIDMTAGKERLLDMVAIQGARSTFMGGSLPLAAGETAMIDVTVSGIVDATLELVLDGQRWGPSRPAAPTSLILTGDGKPHWLRAQVRGSDGALLLIGNPIHFEPPH